MSFPNLFNYSSGSVQDLLFNHNDLLQFNVSQPPPSWTNPTQTNSWTQPSNNVLLPSQTNSWTTQLTNNTQVPVSKIDNWMTEKITPAPDNLTEVLSRYHFMGITQTRSFYSEYTLGSSPIRVEKIIRVNLPSNPETNAYIRQLKLYLYLTNNQGKVIPLKGPIEIYRRMNLDGSSKDEAAWSPVTASNVEWTFIDNDDPNERHNQLLFAPLKITPSEISDGTNTYEIRIRFDPELPIPHSSYKVHTRGSDKQQSGNIQIYYPALSVYFTTCPTDSEYCRNLLLEVVASLINIADRAGVYNDTEYSGAASRVVSALPQLRITPNGAAIDFRKEIQSVKDSFGESHSELLNKLNEVANRGQPTETKNNGFMEWATQTNINEINRLRNENIRLQRRINQLELNEK